MAPKGSLIMRSTSMDPKDSVMMGLVCTSAIFIKLFCHRFTTLNDENHIKAAENNINQGKCNDLLVFKHFMDHDEVNE